MITKPARAGTHCLLVQSKFSALSFWNYVDVCRLTGAKYPASPLGLMTVAALLPQDWEFKLLDENVEHLTNADFEWADIVCTGGMLPQQHSILAVIETAHRHNRSVVVGGPDPTSQPEVYQTADFLVLGEGEITIPMFLEDLKAGATGGTYQSSDRADMAQAVTPRFDLIDFTHYMHIGIQYTRGCPFLCEFCDIIELYGRIPRSKTNEQVMKELQMLYDLGYRGYVDLVDDNFIGNKRNVKKLLPAIKEWSQAHRYPFFFATEASLNLVTDEPLLQMMQDVDFRYVFIGLETPEEDILQQTQKQQNVNISIRDAVKKIGSYGMVVPAGFIIGFDNESDRTAERMERCIQESDICLAMVGTLMALPNTQLTRRLQKEGRLFAGYSTQKVEESQVDQMTSGLNFVTTRPRADILRDYTRVLNAVYDPTRYFTRVLHTALNLRPANKYRPPFREIKKLAKGFLCVCKVMSSKKETARLYWKTFFVVLFRNPWAIEQAVSLAAMFIHLKKHVRFVEAFTNNKIEHIHNIHENHYNRLMLGKPETITQEGYPRQEPPVLTYQTADP